MQPILVSCGTTTIRRYSDFLAFKVILLFFCLFPLARDAYLPLDHVSDVAWSLDNKRIAVVQKECSEIVMAKLSVGAAPVQSTTTIPEVFSI